MGIHMESYISDFPECPIKINPPILAREYCDMKDSQDHIIEPVPLLIKERPWVEISSTGLAESIEQCKEGGSSGKLISYPEPSCE